MGQFCCGRNNEDKITYNLLLLGLQNSGKTEVGHALMDKKRDSFESTNGVKLYTKQCEAFDWTMTEIGGSEEMQRIWHHYFVKAMAIVFCFDLSSNYDELQKSFAKLEFLIAHRFLQGKPFLLVGTKSDLADHSIQLYDIENEFQLEKKSAQYKTNIRLCCFEPDKTDSLLSGMGWLSDYLSGNYRRIVNTIKYDVDVAQSTNYPVKRKKKSRLSVRILQSKRFHVKVRPKTAPVSSKTRRSFETRPSTSQVYTIPSRLPNKV